MGTIAILVLAALITLSVIDGVVGLIGAFFGCWLILGLNLAVDSHRTGQSGIDKAHDRNIDRQGRKMRQWSFLKFRPVTVPSLVDQRTQGIH